MGEATNVDGIHSYPNQRNDLPALCFLFVLPGRDVYVECSRFRERKSTMDGTIHTFQSKLLQVGLFSLATVQLWLETSDHAERATQ